jgi:hypothetical protein
MSGVNYVPELSDCYQIWEFIDSLFKIMKIKVYFEKSIFKKKGIFKAKRKISRK